MTNVRTTDELRAGSPCSRRRTRSFTAPTTPSKVAVWLRVSRFPVTLTRSLLHFPLNPTPCVLCVRSIRHLDGFSWRKHIAGRGEKKQGIRRGHYLVGISMLSVLCCAALCCVVFCSVLRCVVLCSSVHAFVVHHTVSFDRHCSSVVVAANSLLLLHHTGQRCFPFVSRVF